MNEAQLREAANVQDSFVEPLTKSRRKPRARREDIEAAAYRDGFQAGVDAQDWVGSGVLACAAGAISGAGVASIGFAIYILAHH